MAIILNKYKGESATFGFRLPDNYPIENMEDVKVFIGSKEYTHVIDNIRTVRVELKSEETMLITGRNTVIFHIDDVTFGIRKILVGEFQVDATQDRFNDSSVNLGYDVLIMLTVEVDMIEVGSVLYDIAKGDSAFVVWQKEPGNEGKTKAEYFAYLQQPATTAAQAANEAAEDAAEATTAANTAANTANAAKGWTPVTAFEAYGTKQIKKLTGYIGGTGAEPTDNVDLYFAASGFTADKDLAVDFRGVQGEQGVTDHILLINKNSEAAFQHIDTTVTKPALDAADMVAIKDSVTGKMVLTPKSNLQTDLTAVNQAITNLQNNKADKTQEAWITPTLINNNTQVDGYPVAYRKDNFGVVHLKGRIKYGGVNGNAFVMPTGYRPLASFWTPVIINNNTKVGNLAFFSSGPVYITSDATTYTELNGVSFFAEQ